MRGERTKLKITVGSLVARRITGGFHSTFHINDIDDIEMEIHPPNNNSIPSNHDKRRRNEREAMAQEIA
jgi:hypothetical protein